MSPHRIPRVEGRRPQSTSYFTGREISGPAGPGDPLPGRLIVTAGPCFMQSFAFFYFQFVTVCALVSCTY